jgi:hypothetical protein
MCAWFGWLATMATNNEAADHARSDNICPSIKIRAHKACVHVKVENSTKYKLIALHLWEKVLDGLIKRIAFRSFGEVRAEVSGMRVVPTTRNVYVAIKDGSNNALGNRPYVRTATINLGPGIHAKYRTNSDIGKTVTIYRCTYRTSHVGMTTKAAWLDVPSRYRSRGPILFFVIIRFVSREKTRQYDWSNHVWDQALHCQKLRVAKIHLKTIYID